MINENDIHFSAYIRLTSENRDALEKMVNDKFKEWMHSPAGHKYVLNKIEEVSKSWLSGFFGWDFNKTETLQKVRQEIVDRFSGEVLEALHIVAKRHELKDV